MTASELPLFDLSLFEKADAAERAGLGRRVDAICRETGFLAISGHSIPQHCIDAVWNSAAAFFDLTPARKNKAKAPFPGYPYGYFGPGAEALAKSKGVETPPDLKESFNGGPLAVPDGLTDPEALSFCYADTIWPIAPEDFRRNWEAYYRAMEQLAGRIMRIFAVALGLPDTTFDNAIGRPISALRALNYPETSVAPQPGQLRAGAHTDYGSLTILLPQPGSSGLQIFTPEGDWREIAPMDGAFIINIGDLMARWTNDIWISTLHRVVTGSGAAASARRQSLAFFHQPNWDFDVRCLESCVEPGEVPKYETVKSGPYLMSKFRSTVKAA